MTITVRVTSQNIKKGERQSFTDCPIALALDGVVLWPRVSSTRWFGNRPTTYEGIGGPLPQSARRFVQRFDKRLPVEPTVFRLTVEEESP